MSRLDDVARAAASLDEAEAALVKAIDRARAERHTWAEISAAMGSPHRSTASNWRRRRQTTTTDTKETP